MFGNIFQLPPTAGIGPDLSYDEQVLPQLQELLETAPVGGYRSEPVATETHDLLSLSLPDLPSLSSAYSPQAFNSSGGLFGRLPCTDLPSAGDLGGLQASRTCREEVKQESIDAEASADRSPTDSSNSKDQAASKPGERIAATALDKKVLAKQRYREKNRKAQARHRERNKKTIEDLTAKVSALTAENSNLKLEMAIVSTVAKAKDEHYSKLRKTKEDLAYVEAESLISESYKLANGLEAELDQETLENWCLQDSANVRQQNVKKMANLLVEGSTSSIALPEKLQGELMRKRQLSLRFAVGKPRFVRSLYAWEREYSKSLNKPNFDDLWRHGLAVMRFTPEQRMQTVRARALLLSKLRTITHERKNLVAAAAAGAMEGVADVLVSSLEEERQAVFGFLFAFFDEILTILQECSCDVELFPWAPDVLAMSDLLIEEAVVASPTGIEGLNLPAHLIPTTNGTADLYELLKPAKQQLPFLSEEGSQVAMVAACAGVAWPPETPFQLLSIPVTTRSCGTAGISILRNVLMFAGGVMPVQLPDMPREVLIQIPILRMIRQSGATGQ